MKTIEEQYFIEERAKALVKQHGTIAKAVLFLRSELNEMESLWSKYSSDCLGHGITCTRLLIEHLEKP